LVGYIKQRNTHISSGCW